MFKPLTPLSGLPINMLSWTRVATKYGREKRNQPSKSLSGVRLYHISSPCQGTTTVTKSLQNQRRSTGHFRGDGRPLSVKPQTSHSWLCEWGCQCSFPYTLTFEMFFKSCWPFLHTRLLPSNRSFDCSHTSSYKRVCLLQGPNHNPSPTSDTMLYTKSSSAIQSSVFSLDLGCKEEHFHFPWVRNSDLPCSVYSDVLPTMVRPWSVDLSFWNCEPK